MLVAAAGILVQPAYAADDAAPAAPGDAFSLPPLEALAEVVARPLFMPTRRPPPAASATDTLLQPPNFALAGIVTTRSQRIAMIETGGNTKTPFASVSVGDTIDGWTVAAIESASILLRAGDRTVEVTMRDKAPAWRAPAVVQPSARRP